MKKCSLYILLLCGIVVMLTSCHIKPRGVLSEKKMEEILFEMHKTEGTLQAEDYMYSSPEQKKLYFDVVLKKYGVEQAVFDSSLVWYTKHPKEFGLVYGKVLARIDTLNAQVQRGEFRPGESGKTQEMDIWNLRRTYKLTKDSARTSIDFEIANNDNLMVGDKYELRFLRRVAPSDSSEHPYIVLRVNYLNGKKDSIYTKTHNDSILRRYKLLFSARDTLKIKSITGSLLGAKKPKGKMNAFLDSITLVRRYNAYEQIKLKKRLETKDTTKLVKPI